MQQQVKEIKNKPDSEEDLNVEEDEATEGEDACEEEPRPVRIVPQNRFSLCVITCFTSHLEK